MGKYGNFSVEFGNKRSGGISSVLSHNFSESMKLLKIPAILDLP